MAPTPIWVTLVTASLGGLLTLVGVMITQRHARLREDARWDREWRREQTRWAREDVARSYEHRRKVYVEFIQEFHRWREEFAIGDNEDIVSWYDMLLYDLLMQIWIFGTNKAAQLANEAFNTLVDAVSNNEDIPEAEDVLTPLRNEIRRDLSIPSLAQDW
jgi:hypothetical protein